jgi:hypothetical protein
MNIYRPVKFASDHAAPVTGVECRLRRAGFFRVPCQRAESVRVPFAITRARPGRFITGLEMIVPDQRSAVSRALIRSFAARDIHQHEQRNANKEESPSHLGTQYCRQRRCALLRRALGVGS